MPEVCGHAARSGCLTPCVFGAVPSASAPKGLSTTATFAGPLLFPCRGPPDRGRLRASVGFGLISEHVQLSAPLCASPDFVQKGLESQQSHLKSREGRSSHCEGIMAELLGNAAGGSETLRDPAGRFSALPLQPRPGVGPRQKVRSVKAFTDFLKGFAATQFWTERSACCV